MEKRHEFGFGRRSHHRLLKGEPGGDIVSDRMDEAAAVGGPVCAHVLNWCEVFYGYSRAYDVLTARAVLEDMDSAGIETRRDVDAAFCEDAAQLKADWRRISLADCCGVALARRLNAEFLTTDRHELEPLQAANVARISFIR